MNSISIKLNLENKLLIFKKSILFVKVPLPNLPLLKRVARGGKPLP